MTLAQVLASVAVVLLGLGLHVHFNTLIPFASTYSFSDAPPLPRPNTLLRLAVPVRTNLKLMAPEGFAHTPDNRYLFMTLMTGSVVGMEVSTGHAWIVARMGSKKDDSCDVYSYEHEPECGRPLGISFDRDGKLNQNERYGFLYNN
jgi:hypothetical protein